jgi:DNA-binding phage protein
MMVPPSGLLPAPEVQAPTTTAPSAGEGTVYANPEDQAAIEKARWEQARASSPAMQKLNQMEADRKAKQATQQAKVDQMKAAQSAFTTATPENGLIRPPTQEQIDTEQAKADSFNNIRTIAVTNKDGLNIYHGTLNENGKVNVVDPTTGKKLTFNPNSPNVSIDPSEKELYALETKHTLGKASADIDSQIKDATKGITGNQDQFKTWLRNNPIDQSQANDVLPSATKPNAKTGFIIKPDARTIFNKDGKPLDDVLAKALEDGIITPEEYNNPADNSGENAFKAKLEALYGKKEVIPTPENEDALAHIANLSNQKDQIENEIDKRNEFINAPEMEPLSHEEMAAQAASPEATGIPEHAEPNQALPLATEENVAPQQEIPAPTPETNIGPNGQALFERGATYSPADKQKVRNLADKLRASLNKMGLQNVGLKLSDALNAHVDGKLESVNGAYLDKLIHLSLSGDDIFRTMNHEALHAMKDLGFFSQADWKTLSDMAEKEWMEKYDIAKDYGHESKEIQIEEAVAKAFADYQTQKPSVRAIMAKIVGAIKRFANVIHGMKNDRTAQTIFAEAAKGKLSQTVKPNKFAGTRFEINPTTDRLTKISETKTAGKRIQETILNAYHDIQSNEFWTKARIAWVDPTTQLAKDLASQPIFNMKGQLRADMLARTMTQIMNYVHSGIQMGLPMINSDGTLGIHETENNLARSQILADKLDGKKIRDVNGKVMSGRDSVAEIARILRGRDIIREDKVRNAQGIAQLQKASQLVQEYKRLQKESGGKLSFEKANQYVNQIKFLRKEGELNKNLNRELQVKNHHIQWAESTLNNNPEIKQILGIWKTVNDSLVNLWEKVGLFSKQQADQYRNNENYVPLFKSKEDLEDGINRYLGVASSPTSKKEIKKLQGSLAVRNIWENMNSHYASMVTSAYQNQTRKVAIEQLKALGAAEIVNPKNANDKEVNMRYRDPTSPFADSKGWVNAVVYNPNTLAAFEMMHYEVAGFMKFMAGATKLLRVTALVNPKYWIKQLIRDPIHATLVSNSGIVTPLHAIRDYIEVLKDASPEAKILASRGVIGQIDPTTDIFDFIKKAGEERNDPNALEKALHQVNRMHEMSDAATRVSIYKKAFAEAKSRGMDNDQATNYAVHKARESINFSVHGNSKMLNNIRHMIPFVSAQITSLDSVYRAMFAKHLSGPEKAEAQRAFRNAAMVMTMATLAYAMMYSGNDDYDKVPDVVKDNNWLIPNPLEKGSFIKIPIPFEVGYLFKVLPEVGVRYMKGDSTGKEVLASLKAGFLNNVPGGGISPWNFTPQAFRPILETMSNYSNFTGRPIEGMSDEGKPVAFRGDRASELAKHLSGMGLDKLNLSPAKIDYLIQAYTAELGTSASSIASYAIAGAEGKPTVAKNISEYPGLSGFMTDPNSSKAVADFYDLDHKASELYTEFNALKKTGQGQQAKEMLSDEQNKKLIQSAPTLRRIQTEMTKIHQAINVTRANANLTPEERRDRINKLEQELDYVARQGYKVSSSVGLDR